MIARIANAEIEDITTEDGKSTSALGRIGGRARADGNDGQAAQRDCQEGGHEKAAQGLALDLQVLIDNGTFYESPE
jgi:hypothetical protein